MNLYQEIILELIGAAVRATHALQLDYLEWIEQNGTLASQTKG